MSEIVQLLVKVTPEQKKKFDLLSQELRLSKSEIVRLMIDWLETERVKEVSPMIDYLLTKGEFRSVGNRIRKG